jgi:hypothetical protein
MVTFYEGIILTIYLNVHMCGWKGEKGGYGDDDQEKEETTIEGLTKKFPWWSSSAAVGRTTDPEARVEELARVFKGKNTSL